MLVVKNCSLYGDNGVFESHSELKEWPENENAPFIRVINTEKHSTLNGKTVTHKKDFIRVKVPHSVDPSGFITIPSEHIIVDNEKYTVNRFFRKFRYKNEGEETDKPTTT